MKDPTQVQQGTSVPVKFVFKIYPDGATGVYGVVLEDTKESGASNIHTSVHSRKTDVNLPPKSPKNFSHKSCHSVLLCIT